MESCLLNYFILNDELKSTCDFNPYLFIDLKPVYEVVRIEKGIPLFFEDHIKRFYDSLKYAGVETEDLSEKRLRTRIKVLLEINKISTGLIKFLYFKKEDNKGVFIAWIAPFVFPSKMQYKEGVEVKLLNGEREHPNTKFAHLPIREKADKIIKESGVYEVLLLNKENIITEGSRSNIFFVKDNTGILFTPSKNLVLNGITRSKIIGIAIDNGIDVMESCYYSSELSDFSSAFLTGTSPKVLPIKKIENVILSTSDKMILLLMDRYDKLIDNYVKQFSW